MCHKTGYGSWVFLVRCLLLTGFVQSLEFLKKSWSFPSTFPELEKVCKIEVKSWKNGKKSWFFFKATTSSSQVKRVLCLWNLIQSRLHVMEKASFLQGFFFKLSIDHLFHNLESGKKNYCFGKSLEKVLNFVPKICANPVLMFQRKKARHLSPLCPKSDQHQFSPNNISSSSRVKVMRISKMFTKGKMLWSFIKFSQLIL